MTGPDDRTLVVDASVFITLVEIEAIHLLGTNQGLVAVPDAVEPDEAKRLVTAMDQMGARLSAGLFRTAGRLINEAAED